MLLNGHLTSLVGKAGGRRLDEHDPRVDFRSRSASAKEPAGSTARQALARTAAFTIHQKRRRQDARDQNVLSQFGAGSASHDYRPVRSLMRRLGLDIRETSTRASSVGAADLTLARIDGHATANYQILYLRRKDHHRTTPVAIATKDPDIIKKLGGPGWP
jgi:hypothetical protein